MNFITFVHRARPDIPTNPVFLPRALAEIGNRVLMVEVKERRNDLTLRPWNWGETVTYEYSPNLTVLEYTPALPSRLPLTAGLAISQFRAKVERVMRALFSSEPATVILFSPNEARFLEIVPELPFVYRIIDDYPTMPFYASDPAAARRLDESLCVRAEAIFPSNPKLLGQRKGLNRCHLLIPNGVDFALFGARGLPVPADMAALPRPIVGFSGAVDRYKLDMGLVAEIAALRPSWTVALIGKVGTGDDTTDRELPQAPNLRYLGFRPYSDLPDYVAAFDVGIIPYSVNPYTEGVSPLKLYEYLAAGKAVVSTPLPFASEAGPVVRTAIGATAFVEQIEAVLAEEGKEEERRAIAEANSWPARARAMVEVLAGRSPDGGRAIAE